MMCPNENRNSIWCPPEYVTLLGMTREEMHEWGADIGDIERVQAIQRGEHPFAKRAIRTYLQRETDSPYSKCCWLNEASGECRWFHIRPQACRVQLVKEFPSG